VNHAVLTAGVVAAILRGDREARAVAAYTAAQGLLLFTRTAPWLDGPLADGLGLAVCLAVLPRATGYWIIWATAANLLSVATDVLYQAVPTSLWTYLSAQLVWTYALAAALLFSALPRQHETRTG
jgi:hypothetical protein